MLQRTRLRPVNTLCMIIEPRDFRLHVLSDKGTTTCPFCRVHFDDDDYEHEDDEDSHHSSKESKEHSEPYAKAPLSPWWGSPTRAVAQRGAFMQHAQCGVAKHDFSTMLHFAQRLIYKGLDRTCCDTSA